METDMGIFAGKRPNKWRVDGVVKKGVGHWREIAHDGEHTSATKECEGCDDGGKNVRRVQTPRGERAFARGEGKIGTVELRLSGLSMVVRIIKYPDN